MELVNNENMNKELLIETINKDIQDIEKFIKNLNNRAKLTRVDLDLIMEKVRRLYDTLYSLNDKLPGIETTPPDTGSDFKIKSEKEEKRQTEEKDISETPPVFTKESDQKKEKKSQFKNSKEKNDKTKIVADRLQNKQSFRNESLRQQVSSKDLSSKITSNPITDIGASMGLNEKFSFIQELFNNDPDKFTETINILNNSSDYNEAYSYLTDNFNWDMDDPQVQKLLDLTRRKLIIRGNE